MNPKYLIPIVILLSFGIWAITANDAYSFKPEGAPIRAKVGVGKDEPPPPPPLPKTLQSNPGLVNPDFYNPSISTKKLHPYRGKAKGLLNKIRNKARNFSAGGAEWTCEGMECSGAGPLENPDVNTCRALAREVGELVSYSHAGKRLTKAELVECNRAGGPTRSESAEPTGHDPGVTLLELSASGTEEPPKHTPEWTDPSKGDPGVTPYEYDDRGRLTSRTGRDTRGALKKEEVHRTNPDVLNPDILNPDILNPGLSPDDDAGGVRFGDGVRGARPPGKAMEDEGGTAAHTSTQQGRVLLDSDANESSSPYPETYSLKDTKKAANTIMYHAGTRAVIKKGKMRFSATGTEWTCEGMSCAATGPPRNPTVGLCRALAQAVGELTTYSHGNIKLTPMQIVECNSGLSGLR